VIVADNLGNWTALPYSGNLFSLTDYPSGFAYEYDEDGDETFVGWKVMLPGDWNIFAYPERDFIELQNAKLDLDYTLTVTRASDPNRVVYSVVSQLNRTTQRIEFPMQGFDLQVGDTVTTSSAQATKSLLIAPRAPSILTSIPILPAAPPAPTICFTFMGGDGVLLQRTTVAIGRLISIGSVKWKRILILARST